MKFALVALFGLFSGSAALSVTPKPTTQESDGNSYSITSNFDFNSGSENGLLSKAIDRYSSLIFGPRENLHEMSVLKDLKEKGVLSVESYETMKEKLITKDSKKGFEWYREEGSASLIDGGDITGCDITIDDDSIVTKALDTDESYHLTVAAPRIQISAPTVFGAIYALESLSQLVESGTTIDGTSIADKPRFAFRAIMIDTSRHWLHPKVIKQHMDAMAYSKFNVLHWHLVDSVSFPFQSTSFPQMSVDGAYLPNEIYTHDDIKELVKYGIERGIRIIPEFDTPGHVYRGWESLGVLTQCYDGDGNEADYGPLNPTLDHTYDVLSTFYDEVKEVFAPETFVHVGGDEVPDTCWSSNPQIAEWMEEHPEIADFAGLETEFETRLLTDLQDKGMSYMVWQEIFDNGAKILDDTNVNVWKGGNWQDEMANVTAAGYHSVLSAPFYLNVINYGKSPSG